MTRRDADLACLRGHEHHLGGTGEDLAFGADDVDLDGAGHVVLGIGAGRGDAVGLGVSTREQAKGVAGYADGVIVGSAFIKAMQDATNEAEGLKSVKELAQQLSLGVREGR